MHSRFFVAALAQIAAISVFALISSPAQQLAVRPAKSIRADGYRTVKVYPHDPAAFTQGLEYRAGVFYEGTGLNGRSTLRKVDPESGRVLQETRLNQSYFGEGITVLNSRIIQLTWQSQVGFVYDQASFKPLRTWNYPGEGWGLANDGQTLYMSDGSAQIRCLDPQTLREVRRINVHQGTQPVTSLNELEWVRGEIYANVYTTDRIVRISPKDGRVLGWVDLSGLLGPEERVKTDVLNGIAYDATGDRLFVTGKLWPKLFEIRIAKNK